MKRTVTSVGATLGVLCALLTTTRAHAQQQYEFGQRGEFIISAERLVPFLAFSHESNELPPFRLPGGTTKVVTGDSQSSLSLLYSYTANANDLFYTVPRVGFDYVVANNFTVGGDLVVFFTLGNSSSTETDFMDGRTTTTTNSAPKNSLFGLAPRAGYIFGLNNVFSIWLRGGLSFYTLSSKTTNTNNNNVDSTDTTSVHQFSLDLDPQLVINPIPHLGFTAGITADLPFGGGISAEHDEPNLTSSVSASHSIVYLGVTLGMLGYF